MVLGQTRANFAAECDCESTFATMYRQFDSVRVEKFRETILSIESDAFLDFLLS